MSGAPAREAQTRPGSLQTAQNELSLIVASCVLFGEGLCNSEVFGLICLHTQQHHLEAQNLPSARETHLGRFMCIFMWNQRADMHRDRERWKQVCSKVRWSHQKTPHKTWTQDCSAAVFARVWKVCTRLASLLLRTCSGVSMKV